MFEWFYQLFVQFVTMVLSWFGIDSKSFTADAFKEAKEEVTPQHVASVLNSESNGEASQASQASHALQASE